MLNDGQRGEHPGSWSAWAAGARVHAWAGSRDVRGQGKKEKKEERRREEEKGKRGKRRKRKRGTGGIRGVDEKPSARQTRRTGKLDDD